MSFANEGSTFLASFRSSNDFSALRLFARADLQAPREAAYSQYINLTFYFFDPLVIQGGTAGVSLQVSIGMEGRVSHSTTSTGLLVAGSGYGYGAKAEFYVHEPETDVWAYAPNQTTEFFDRTDPFATIDTLYVTTLGGFDPTRRYALNGFATVSAAFGRDEMADYETAFVETDAEHTARITGLGFVGSGASGASIRGASGTLYPQAVPEPASLLALGGALLVSGHRRRRRDR